MSDERPVTRYEFDLWREGQHEWRAGQEKRLRSLERWREAHSAEHEAEHEREQAIEVRERRPWRWQEILAAGITAAGVIAAAVVTAIVR